MQFCNILESALQNKNMKQKDLADILNVHPSNISQYVLGKTEPDFKTQMRICQILDIDLTELFHIDKTYQNVCIITDVKEIALIRKYRSLSNEGRAALYKIVKMLKG